MWPIDSSQLYLQSNHDLVISGQVKPSVFGLEVSSGAIISLLVIFLILALIAFILITNLARLHVYLIYHGWTTWDYYCRPKLERQEHSYWKYRVSVYKDYWGVVILMSNT